MKVVNKTEHSDGDFIHVAVQLLCKNVNKIRDLYNHSKHDLTS